MPNPSRKTAAIAATPQKGSWAAGSGLKPEMVLEVDGFIHKQAWARVRAVGYAGLEVEDLVQEGRAGALRAAERFNPDRGVKFLTYASHWIHAAIAESLQQRMIRTPRGNAQLQVISFDDPVPGRGDGQRSTSYQEFLPDESTSIFDDAVMDEVLTGVRRVLPTLEPRDRRILIAHFGLDGREPKGLSDLARELGVSRQRVGQILDRGLEALRKGALGRVA